MQAEDGRWLRHTFFTLGDEPPSSTTHVPAESQEQRQQGRATLVRAGRRYTLTTTNSKKNLEAQIALLKQQMEKVGIDASVMGVSLRDARSRLTEAVSNLMKGDDIAKWENEVEKWDQAIRMNPEYDREQDEDLRRWEAGRHYENRIALWRMRALLPLDIKKKTDVDLQTVYTASVDDADDGEANTVTSDGAKRTAARLLKMRTLHLITLHHSDLLKMHFADLNMCSNQGA